ncbi:hypothetical protein NONI108955_36445 [Nocardia ninae]
MGMNLNVNRLVVSEDGILAPTDLGGWSVRAGFSNTVISGNVCVASGAGSAVLRCRVQLTANWTNANRVLRVIVLQNSTQVKSADFVVGTNSLDLGETSINVASGDRIGVRMATTDELGVTVQSGSNTYVYYDA